MRDISQRDVKEREREREGDDEEREKRRMRKKVDIAQGDEGEGRKGRYISGRSRVRGKRERGSHAAS